MPKLPPAPPRQAQNRSLWLAASISRTSPVAVTIREAQVIAGETGPVGVVADAAAERESADADARQVPPGRKSGPLSMAMKQVVVEGRAAHTAVPWPRSTLTALSRRRSMSSPVVVE